MLVEEVDEWFMALDSDATDSVSGAIDYLEANGPMAGRPIVDKVKGSKYHHMKELRPAGTSIRVLFIFDPKRQAVLLVSGDKAGNWKDWYTDNIPVAEQRYEDWLKTEGE
ncbi:type II toxin-antitoxin system RelE/ParE family toxin [Mycolicibacterium tusciae]|uniref:type II toxin-antitoxin system RelE/ParE family toxin n=1 Tax=Mycolicibacterium tusciae TaxID=75922 RepID=UPI00024A15E0|nr:type II toxin-antitoxin system RelE/ParE family toxin [Mycolicibacterium tusciae]